MIKKLLLIVLTYVCISCTGGLSREEINKYYDCIEKHNVPCDMIEGKKLK